MKSARPLLLSASKIFTGQWLNLAITTTEGILLARSFGPEFFGTWSMMQAIFATISALLGFRVSESLIRHVLICLREKNTGTLSLMINGALVVDLYTTCSTVAAGLLVTPFLKTLWPHSITADPGTIAIYSISLVTSISNNTWSALTRIDSRLWRLSALPATVNTMRLLALIALCTHFQSPPLKMVAATFASSAVLILLLQYRDIQHWKKKNGLQGSSLVWMPWRKPELNEFFTFMRAGFITSSFGAAVKNADILLLGYFSDPHSVANFRLAKSISGALQSVTSALSQAIFVDLAGMAKSPNSIKSLLLLSAQRLSIPISIGYACLAMLMPGAIRILYGEPYVEAASLTNVILIGSWVSMILFWVNPMLLTMNLLREYVFVLVATTALTICAQAALLPSLGPLGAAIAYSVAWAGGHLLGLAVLLRTQPSTK